VKRIEMPIAVKLLNNWNFSSADAFALDRSCP
jgi:hypothetical protein